MVPEIGSSTLGLAENGQVMLYSLGRQRARDGAKLSQVLLLRDRERLTEHREDQLLINMEAERFVLVCMWSLGELNGRLRTSHFANSMVQLTGCLLGLDSNCSGTSLSASFEINWRLGGGH